MRKLKDIRYRYGERAVQYFLKHPYCETESCGEKRLVCLSVHHTHGKKVNMFETLCHNCHAVVHSKNGNIEMEQEVEWFKAKEEKAKQIAERNKKIIKLYTDKFTIEDLSKLFNLSKKRIKDIIFSDNLLYK